MKPTAIILFAHGARNPVWAEPLKAIAQQIQSQGQRVEMAFLELMSPSLADCVNTLASDGIEQIMIVPAFMARGAHLRRDLPAMVGDLQHQYPTLRIEVSPALGESPQVQAAMAKWAIALLKTG